MKFFVNIVLFVLFLFQEPEIDWEIEPVEVYNFFLVLLGIILLIIILVYILLSSKQE